MKKLLTILIAVALLTPAFAGTDPLPNWSGGILTTAGAPSAGTNCIQTLTFGATITSGTFKLKYKGSTTAAITWSATDATLVSNIDAALEATATLSGGSSVTTTQGTISSGVNGTITVTFTGNYAKLLVPVMTVADNSLVGAAHTLTCAITTAGVTADGRSASLGQLLIDSTNKTLYQNTGTALSPTWTAMSGLATSTSPTAGIGYATGAGGTVTQATNRSTGVTLSKVSGQITTNTASLAAAAFADFIVTNTTVAATDTIIVNIVPGGTGSPRAVVVNVGSGSFTIRVTNDHASTADTSADVINFNVIKGVSS